MSSLRVVIVDDHELVRSGVRSALSGHVEVVGEAADVDEAIEVITITRPDVVLLDVHLPGGNGPAVIAGCNDREVSTMFLALSVSDSADDVIAVIRAGARGYVTKNIGADDLVDSVKQVAGGDAVSIRLFDAENVFLPLEHLGFSEHALAAVRRLAPGL